VKAGTEELAKYHDVVDALGIDPPFVGGLLQAIWTFTGKNCPRGDIGRFTNRQIARGIQYTGNIDLLIEILVQTGWLDACECDMRLVVHDWSDHAEDSVHRKLARAREWFWDGKIPNITRLGIEEKKAAKKYYSQTTCVSIARLATRVRTACGLTSAVTVTVTPAVTKPLPRPERGEPDSGLSEPDRIDLDASTLADPMRFERWMAVEEYRFKVSGGDDGWLSGSTDDRVFAGTVREKAITDKTLADPIAWAKDTIRGKHYDRVKAHHEDAARATARSGPSEASLPYTAGIGTGGSA